MTPLHPALAGRALACRALVRALALALAVALPVLAAAPAGAAPSAARAVLPGDFPDPDVLQVSGTYHAYATGGGGTNVRHATSRDLRRWTVQPDLAPQLGAWASASCSEDAGRGTSDCVWAPDVSVVPGTTTFTLHYTAKLAGTSRQCIGVSTAPGPAGPFVPASADPLVCPADTGAIDPATFTDDDGQRYLLWKADGNCCGLPAVIYAQPLSRDGLRLTGDPVELVRADRPWERGVVEAPTLVRHGGRYVLLYSAASYRGSRYATGYATADSLGGPWTKGDGPLMSTQRFGGAVRGPGGQDVITFADGSTRIAFHGWDAAYGQRELHVAGLVWRGGVPSVVGTR